AIGSVGPARVRWAAPALAQSMSLDDTREKRCARSLGELEHLLETVGAAEIGIGHLAHAEFRRKVQKEAEMAPEIRGAQQAQVAQIAPVHCEYPFETREIL